jgi:hypothetical protein
MAAIVKIATLKALDADAKEDALAQLDRKAFKVNAVALAHKAA